MNQFIKVTDLDGFEYFVNVSDISYLKEDVLYLKSLIDEESDTADLNRELIKNIIELDAASYAKVKDILESLLVNA